MSNSIRSIRNQSFSFILNPRLLISMLVFACIAIFIAFFSMTVGDYPISFSQVLNVFTGGGTKIERTVVLEWRAGRAFVALTVGAALGFAGALTQTIARNPLASPDVLGVTNGASLAAVLMIAFIGEHMALVPFVAILGALLTTMFMFSIAGKAARSDMLRLVLIGVGLSTFLSALTTWAIAQTTLDNAAAAKLWLTGSLNGRDWGNLPLPLIVVILALCCAGWLAFVLSALALGPDVAHFLGHKVSLAQAVQLIIAVLLTAVAVSAAGPIGFVAFVSPQIAQRIAKTPTPPLLCSALCGAALVATADLIARVVLPWELPVGIVTSFCGAPVLLYLIIRMNQKNTV